MVSDKAPTGLKGERRVEIVLVSLFIAGGDLVSSDINYYSVLVWTLYDVHTKSLIEKRYSQTN